MLPQARPSSEVYGADCAPTLLGGAIPIAGDAGDQQAATFGQACFAPGMAKNTYGTGCFMLMNTGETAVPSKNNLLTTIGWGLGGKVIYCLEGSVFITGAAVQYLRDSLQDHRQRGRDRGAGHVGREQRRRLRRAGLRRPGRALLGPVCPRRHPGPDPRQRARRDRPRHARSRSPTRAATCWKRWWPIAASTLTELRVDGGMVANNFLMQFQADILGVPVERPMVAETTALGAAYLAGLAVGYWKDQDEISRTGRWTAASRPRWTKPPAPGSTRAGRRPWRAPATGRSRKASPPGPTERRGHGIAVAIPCPVQQGERLRAGCYRRHCDLNIDPARHEM